MYKLKSRYTMLAALLAVPGLVHAVSEREANHPIASAQLVEITFPAGATLGGASVDGVIGNMSGILIKGEVDFFAFSGRAGDVVTLDIDGGWGVGKNVDTNLAVFGPGPAYKVLRQSDDMDRTKVDPGSNSYVDAQIVEFKLPSSGSYIVGVSAAPYDFIDGGDTKCRMDRNNKCLGTYNGDYTLLISGVSPPLLLINIDIKPGSGEVAPINPKAKGKVPVALLGAADFAVDDVNVSKLTFGHSGDEASYFKCGAPSDVNGDAFPDMVCHFENQAAQLSSADSEAILRGELENGLKFQGRGWLKVVPVKEEQE